MVPTSKGAGCPGLDVRAARQPALQPDEWPVTEEELAIMTEGLGLVGLTDVDMPSGRKVVDPEQPCGSN